MRRGDALESGYSDVSALLVMPVICIVSIVDSGEQTYPPIGA
jgi:hypothetical protein